MKQKTKSLFVLIFQPKAFIFCAALFNFIYFWFTSMRMGVACVVCPWYIPWSYNNEPSIILIASMFLLFKRWWTYLVPIALSGYLIEYFLHFWMSIQMTVSEEFQLLLDPRFDIIRAWETQYVLALIVLIFSLFYLGRTYYKKVTKQVYL